MEGAEKIPLFISRRIFYKKKTNSDVARSHNRGASWCSLISGTPVAPSTCYGVLCELERPAKASRATTPHENFHKRMDRDSEYGKTTIGIPGCHTLEVLYSPFTGLSLENCSRLTVWFLNHFFPPISNCCFSSPSRGWKNKFH